MRLAVSGPLGIVEGPKAEEVPALQPASKRATNVALAVQEIVPEFVILVAPFLLRRVRSRG
jgi:hypothetical protein